MSIIARRNAGPFTQGRSGMIGAFEAREPSVGIFWVVQTSVEEARLLSAGCPLEAAEPYGDCLTFPDGHYRVWERWRNMRDHDAALQAIVRTFEYEDWPRGRIVFDRLKEQFVLYADQKLLISETIAKIESRFAIAPEQTKAESLPERRDAGPFPNQLTDCSSASALGAPRPWRGYRARSRQGAGSAGRLSLREP